MLFPHLPLVAQSQQRTDSLHVALANCNQDTARVRLLNALSREYSFVQIDTALAMANRALRLAEQLNFADGKGHAYHNLGIANHVQGNFDAALAHYKTSLAIRETANDTKGIAGLLNNMGSIYNIRGDYPRALVHYQRSLSAKLQLGDSLGAAKTYNNIGIIYYEQKSFEEALTYYRQSLAIEVALNNTRGMARTLGNIGLTHLEMGAYTEAEANYARAYALVDNEELECLRQYPANGLGQTYFAAGDFERSEQYSLVALQAGRNCADPVIVASALRTLGGIQAARGNIVLAQQQLEESYTLADSLHLLAEVEEATQALYNFYKQEGALAKALHYLERNRAVRDSLFNTDLTEQLTRLELNYAFELEKDSLAFARETERITYNAKLERQKVVQYAMLAALLLAIALVVVVYRFYAAKRAANRTLSDKNKQISEALQQKEVLMKEIHHRVKNNLQIVNSLLNVQLRNATSEQTEKALRDTQLRVRSMALLHQHLYQHAQPDLVQADTYIEEVVRSIEQSFSGAEHIATTLNLQPVQIAVNEAVNLGLIVNELVTNAYKHAFPPDAANKPEITIRLHEADEALVLVVADNGIGHHGEAAHTSYGMRLIQSLTKSMRGTLQVTSDTGTNATVRIPLKHES